MLNSHGKEGLPLGPSRGFTWDCQLRVSEAKDAQCTRYTKDRKELLWHILWKER